MADMYKISFIPCFKIIFCHVMKKKTVNSRIDFGPRQLYFTTMYSHKRPTVVSTI